MSYFKYFFNGSNFLFILLALICLRASFRILVVSDFFPTEDDFVTAYFITWVEVGKWFYNLFLTKFEMMARFYYYYFCFWILYIGIYNIIIFFKYD